MDPDTVKLECEKTIADGIQILAPGTPLENILTMVAVTSEH